MAKACICCGETKPISEFYAHKMMADGHLNKCKPCCRASSIKNRNENLDRYKAYDRSRGMLDHRVKMRSEYQKTEAGKAAVARASKRFIERNPEKRSAHIKVGNAVRDGKLIKMPCEVCGEKKVHAHHDDYSKQLEVRWLCSKHHSHEHKKAPN